jgi:hypothetical protein
MKHVPFDALGKPRELRYSFNALCRLEERAGADLSEVISRSLKPGSQYTAIRLLMWAGVAGITLEEAGDIIEEVGRAEAERLITEAIKLAFPINDDEPGNVKADSQAA